MNLRKMYTYGVEFKILYFLKRSWVEKKRITVNLNQIKYKKQSLHIIFK